jgi:DNA-binding NtrC family response regulator
MKGNILIVEDNKGILTALEMLLSDNFTKVMGIKHPKTLLSTVREHAIDVVLLDMNFTAGSNNGNEGIYWLTQLKENFPDVSVVMVTAHGDVELAVRAVKDGAFDFILKPWENNKLIATVRSALEMRKSKSENTRLKKQNAHLKESVNKSEYSIIGQSSAMKHLMQMVDKVAATEANILITGENGTGKELIARALHQRSKRNNQLMVSVDMGAISETLFESELFGHVKGSFTDARENRAGKMEAAHNGSLFLDEIGNLSMAMQQKLLAALQNRSITRVGSNENIPVDIRLISATNKNLLSKVDNQEFREDLLYRINTITLEVPPLRNRGADIILLAEYYLLKYCNKYEKGCLQLSESAKDELMKYAWPGNVRELQHTMEKAVILCEGNNISAIDLNLNGHNVATTALEFKTIEEMERQMIINALDKENGNMSSVAKNLGITRQTLYNKLKKFNL